MKQINKKIPGFSLSEVLFNMILVAIITSCGYMAYLFSYKDAMLFGKANDEMTAFVQFSNAFGMDEELCEEIWRSGEELNMRFGDGKEVRYKMGSVFVLRCINESTDTFKLKVLNLHTQFEAKDRQEGLVDRGEVEVLGAGKNFVVGFTKMYDAVLLMQQEERRENGH